MVHCNCALIPFSPTYKLSTKMVTFNIFGVENRDANDAVETLVETRENKVEDKYCYQVIQSDLLIP